MMMPRVEMWWHTCNGNKDADWVFGCLGVWGGGVVDGWVVGWWVAYWRECFVWWWVMSSG